jgi:hypothetical protein
MKIKDIIKDYKRKLLKDLGKELLDAGYLGWANHATAVAPYIYTPYIPLIVTPLMGFTLDGPFNATINKR